MSLSIKQFNAVVEIIQKYNIDLDQAIQLATLNNDADISNLSDEQLEKIDEILPQ